MHTRNIHRNGYPFEELSQLHPPLANFLATSTKAKISIDFANPNAVKALNAALLNKYYEVKFWDIPPGFLCPAVPGRADYIHHIADLLADGNSADIPTGKNVKGLDVGTGANLIYPIIGSQSYGWQFVGSDVSPISIKSAKAIINANASLTKYVKIRQQSDSKSYFKNIIGQDDYFDFTLCNPPFHSSKEAAEKGNVRKLKGLQHNQNKQSPNRNTKANFKHIGQSPALNFGGQNNELWCEGGELKFVLAMIEESIEYKSQVGWFTCLVSKSQHLNDLKKAILKHRPSDYKQIDMGQGNKLSRFIAWTFA